MKKEQKWVNEEINEGVDMYYEKQEGEFAEGFHHLQEYTNEFSDDDCHEVYTWYKSAMERRDREPLDEDYFTEIFFDQPNPNGVIFGDPQLGYLFGGITKGFFSPSHFAPKSMRSGYNLFKRLGESKQPSVLFITEDLAETLKKMPSWEISQFKMPAYFRGEMVMKTIAHNNIPNFEKKFEEYLGGMKNYART